MNTKILLTTVIALSSIGNVFAQQNITIGKPDSEISTPSKSRADVIAEFQRAEEDGSAALHRFPDATYRGAHLQAGHSNTIIVNQKSRAEVNGELKQTQATGNAIPTSLAGFHTPASNAPTSTPTRTANQK